MDGRLQRRARVKQLFLLAVLTVSLLVSVTTATARCYNPAAPASHAEEQLKEEQVLKAKTAYTGVFDPDEKVQIGLLRWYDPNLQRFINRDPIGERGGINLYQFVGNNPLSYVDPYGLDFRLGPSPIYPAGPIPYLGGDTPFENLVGGAYNLIPAVGNIFAGMGAVQNAAIGALGNAAAQASGDPAVGQGVKNVLIAGSLLPGGCPGSGLIGVSECEAAALARQISGIEVNGQKAVKCAEAFGSRAGSTFRGRGPLATSDLDVRLTLSNPEHFGAVHAEMSEVATLWEATKGFPLQVTYVIPGVPAPVLIGTPFIPLIP